MTPPPGLLVFEDSPTTLLNYEVSWNASGNATKEDFVSWIGSVGGQDITPMIYDIVESQIRNIQVGGYYIFEDFDLSDVPDLGINLFYTSATGPIMIYNSSDAEQRIEDFIATQPENLRLTLSIILENITSLFESEYNYTAYAIDLSNM
jgi:hypothetical protein